ncbi:IS6 family transposase (plasmid) [Pseudorhodobacter turbinis]|uniref:IS6 family transposase n=1 Tax=Pseudorhodobacter turbinis TaxID=2500533 RepID=A0A4P8EL40_9RHOB|nr:IS6 family transposase [Pseudorhodobacter turbinis]
MSVDFKGAHYPKSVILCAVYFYVRYRVSYRDLDEIMEERGAEVDHATLNRWVVTLAGIETVHMIRKGQIHANGLTAFQQFAALAA